jgi:hypothetical protein
VVDVDDPPGQRLAQVVRQHLHVPGEDDQLDTLLTHDVEQPGLSLGLRVLRHRNVVEGDVVRVHQLREVRVVGHHTRDLHRQRPGTRPEQQIVQAVPELADHQQDAHLLVGPVDLPVHLEGVTDRRETGPQLVQGHRRVRREVDAHEEQSRVVVAELLAVLDVAAGHEQIARHGVHDALPVRTEKGEDVLIGRGLGAGGLLVHAGQVPTRADGTGNRPARRTWS